MVERLFQGVTIVDWLTLGGALVVVTFKVGEWKRKVEERRRNGNGNGHDEPTGLTLVQRHQLTALADRVARLEVDLRAVGTEVKDELKDLRSEVNRLFLELARRHGR